MPLVIFERLTKDGDAHPSINPFCGSYHAER